MNDINVLFKGLLIGFSIAAPVGPIGVLCIRRTLAEGHLVGFLSGLGAASADMLFGAIAAFGLTAVQTILVGQRDLLALAGGIFLLYLGARTFFSKPAQDAANTRGSGKFTAWMTTFFLTLTNPMTILSFIVIFAGLRLGESNGDFFSAVLMVLGVFLGSAAWWLTLSAGVSLLRDRFTPVYMTWVNRIAGIIIFVFGMVAIFS